MIRLTHQLCGPSESECSFSFFFRQSCLINHFAAILQTDMHTLLRPIPQYESLNKHRVKKEVCVEDEDGTLGMASSESQDNHDGQKSGWIRIHTLTFLLSTVLGIAALYIVRGACSHDSATGVHDPICAFFVSVSQSRYIPRIFGNVNASQEAVWKISRRGSGSWLHI
jgi:hypothetical protein